MIRIMFTREQVEEDYKKYKELYDAREKLSEELNNIESEMRTLEIRCRLSSYQEILKKIKEEKLSQRVAEFSGL